MKADKFPEAEAVAEYLEEQKATTFPRIHSQAEVADLYRREKELRHALRHDRIDDLLFRALTGIAVGGTLGFLLGLSL